VQAPRRRLTGKESRMTEVSRQNKTTGMAGSVAPLANVAALAELIERCNNRTDGLPGMGCFYGRAGRGKTHAGIYSAIRLNAVHVEALPIGGVKGLLNGIVHELGLKPERSTDGLFYQICRELMHSRRPLIIDEAEAILKETPVEIIRKIHDKTGCTIILMGEEELPQRLKAWERVDSRMLDHVGAAEATLKDVDILAGLYAPGVVLDADLKALLLKASGGSLRYLSTNLDKVKEHAAVHSLRSLTLAQWGERRLHTGEAPMPRHSAPRDMVGRRGLAA
jgi:DNA transposition AAA+ family ATPase